VFNVIYEPKLRAIMGGDNFFLGMKDEEQATRDKTNMRMVLPRADAQTIVKPQVDILAEDVMSKAPGRVDLVTDLSQNVASRFFGAYFGTPGPDLTIMSDWARLLFQFVFADSSNDPALRAQAEPIAGKLRVYLETAITERKAYRGDHEDILGRCLKLQDLEIPGMTDRDIRNNLMGFIVGGFPQAAILIPQLFDILLDRPNELAAACAAAQADNDELVSKYIFEAARYHPLAPGLFRQCTDDYKLAGGSFRGKTIPEGAFVVAVTRSAMFDGRRVTNPKEFRIDRPDYHYMQFGHGFHECFGLYMNQQMLPAMCKSVLKKKNLRRAAGDAGRLQMSGIFPKSLVVEFE
jgi:cytochrome P450